MFLEKCQRREASLRLGLNLNGNLNKASAVSHCANILETENNFKRHENIPLDEIKGAEIPLPQLIQKGCQNKQVLKFEKKALKN